MDKIYVRCPLDGAEHQKYCCLVDHYKETGTINECQHHHECAQMVHHINNKERNLNEII